MKKLFVLLIALGVVIYLSTIGFIYFSDQERSQMLTSSVDISDENIRIQEFFYKKGCDHCHTNRAVSYFYKKGVRADMIFESDVKQGIRAFLLDPILNNLREGHTTIDLDLSKIERAIENNTMPPLHYQLLHWSGTISAEDKKMILNWVEGQRD